MLFETHEETVAATIIGTNTDTGEKVRIEVTDPAQIARLQAAVEQEDIAAITAIATEVSGKNFTTDLPEFPESAVPDWIEEGRAILRDDSLSVSEQAKRLADIAEGQGIHNRSPLGEGIIRAIRMVQEMSRDVEVTRSTLDDGGPSEPPDTSTRNTPIRVGDIPGAPGVSITDFLRDPNSRGPIPPVIGPRSEAWYGGHYDRAQDMILAERQRQFQKYGIERNKGMETWATIMQTRMGKVAQTALDAANIVARENPFLPMSPKVDDAFNAHLAEVVKMAAVATAWVECLIRGNVENSEPLPPALMLTRTSYDWLRTPAFRGVRVIDPDGWERKNLGLSLAEEITADEMWRRVNMSTVQHTS